MMKNKQVVLWLNLGSPDSPEVSDVRRYLAEFLMDPYVLDIPFFLRVMIVYLAILPTRPAKSAHAYQQVWTEEGAPLIVNSRHFLAKVSPLLDAPSYLAMRYANPSILSVISQIKQDHPDIQRLVTIPLYPQYAMSSSLTVQKKVEDVMSKVLPGVEQVTIKPFYKDPGYIDALVHSIQPNLNDIEFLLFSYHGLPVRHIKKMDASAEWCYSRPDCCRIPSDAHSTCYRHQCYETTRLVCEKLGLGDDKFMVSFQSRLGRDPWVKPYTDEVLEMLAERGVKRLHVASPAFVADCLETLEEISIRSKEDFIAAGGEDLVYIPCLNDSDKWVKAAAALVIPYLSSPLKGIL